MYEEEFLLKSTELANQNAVNKLGLVSSSLTPESYDFQPPQE